MLFLSAIHCFGCLSQTATGWLDRYTYVPYPIEERIHQSPNLRFGSTKKNVCLSVCLWHTLLDDTEWYISESFGPKNQGCGDRSLQPLNMTMCQASDADHDKRATHSMERFFFCRFCSKNSRRALLEKTLFKKKMKAILERTLPTRPLECSAAPPWNAEPHQGYMLWHLLVPGRLGPSWLFRRWP